MEELKFEIGSKRSPIILAFKEYKGQKLCDFRKFFENPNSKNDLIPTKKGITINEMQFNQFVSCISENSKNIQEFFNASVIKPIEIRGAYTIGRSFSIEYENDKTVLKIDNGFRDKLNLDQTELFGIVIDELYKSLMDVIEDPNELNLIIDRFDNRLNKRL